VTRLRLQLAVAAGLALVALAAVAYRRSGLLDLPGVPEDLTARSASLVDFAAMEATERALRGEVPARSPAVARAVEGLAMIRRGDPEAGLDRMQGAVAAAPANLALGNAFRMEVLRERRAWQLSRDGRSGLLAEPAVWLRDRSVVFFRRLAATRAEPEVRLQLAAALLDEMLLTPALEVRAGVTVEASEILAGLLRGPDAVSPYYLPALYARGLIYLHRPANLLWSDQIDRSLAPARNDLALCVAVGRRLGVGSAAAQGRLALALGDTYAKEGQADRARSWWQVAAAVGTADLRPAVVERMSWTDEELRNRLEEALETGLSDLDHPLSDMSRLWSPR
jgi:hypothetical protein